ncbi:hypothetical protein AKJ50_02270 [candidate division MSBL1 archaeon SCGC-AAA382A13]|uniref:Uncharacterized protein n=1 Tax=candidate division MSBL1 archaeon SCGC-AAA382A13 TaxID=1698279 RepID=A0A133VDN8_9EURY|nr:hypothetical protein AKJ50_02270 [candidate division MSBL1 archaeon SCGC-AAA382A13]
MSHFDTSNLAGEVKLLDNEDLIKISETAFEILEEGGIKVEDEKALEEFDEGSADVDFDRETVRIPKSLTKKMIRKAPSKIEMFNRNGEKACTLGGKNVNFLPGSATPNLIDLNHEHRKSTIKDQENFARLIDALPSIDIQSGCLTATDAPPKIRDRYRFYPVLKNSTKPIISGVNSEKCIDDIKKMLEVCGLNESPKKPFYACILCPTSPLKMTSVPLAKNLMKCINYDIPIMIVPAPSAGGTSPATIAGTIVQHTAENIASIVLGQIIKPGSRFIFGGAAGIMDMKNALMSYAAPESMLITCGIAEIGKYLGLPTHGFIGLSDAKTADAQAGFEAGLGYTLASQIGINAVSGPGAIASLSSQSFGKLVLDNELIGEMERITEKGIEVTTETLAKNEILEVGPKGDYLSRKHTRKWFRKEQYMPSEIINRSTREKWEKSGRKTSEQIATEKAKKILEKHKPEKLPENIKEKLDEIMNKTTSKI